MIHAGNRHGSPNLGDWPKCKRSNELLDEWDRMPGWRGHHQVSRRFGSPAAGFKAVEMPESAYDSLAIILWWLGIDHPRLAYRHNGIGRRLTDVRGDVRKEIVS